ncbi:hypothetical protein GQ457_10G014530 [Hibiscus cannabinus]
MDDRMLTNKRKKTWRCDVGLKTTRDRKVITCSWIMFWNIEFTYGSISFEEKDLMRYGGTYMRWQEGVFNKQEKDYDKYERKKDEQMDKQYQHALK